MIIGRNPKQSPLNYSHCSNSRQAFQLPLSPPLITDRQPNFLIILIGQIVQIEQTESLDPTGRNVLRKDDVVGREVDVGQLREDVRGELFFYQEVVKPTDRLVQRFQDVESCDLVIRVGRSFRSRL